MKKSLIISFKKVMTGAGIITICGIFFTGIFHFQIPDFLFSSLAKNALKQQKTSFFNECKDLFLFRFSKTVLAAMPAIEPTPISPSLPDASATPAPIPAETEEKSPDSADFSNATSKISVVNHGIIVKNQAGKSFNIESLLKKPLEFNRKTNGYKVLVVHSHTTESYFPTDRSNDAERNMIKIGKEFTSVLEKNGIPTLHITTVHDAPYTASYKNSLASVTQALKEHPTIEAVIDLHRDALYNSNNEKIKPLITINGIETAQVMIVTGTEKGGLPHPNWEENLAFSVKVQNNLIKNFPGLARPVDLRKERFNTHTTKNSIIFEIGANGNTLEEAIAGSRLAAQAVCNVLLEK